MDFKKGLSLLCASGLLLLALTGCGSGKSAGSDGESQETGETQSETKNTDLSNSEIVGQVQSIDDKKITLLLGTLSSEGQPEQAPSGSAEGSDSSNPAQSDNAQPSSNDQAANGSGAAGQGTGESEGPKNTDNPPAQPEGENGSEKPSGKAPSGGQSTFTAGTETVIITLTDDTAIQVESASGETDGSLADITVGAVLDVTIGDQDTATAVVVKSLNGDQGIGGSSAGIGAAADSAESENTTASEES